MREHLGLETDEICKELGLTSTPCWVHLYRARMATRLMSQAQDREPAARRAQL